MPAAGYSQFNDTAYIYTYGGIQNEVCYQAKPTWDKGYILIGSTNSFGPGENNIYVVKTDSLCRHKWSNAYGGTQIQNGYSITPTLDHGYTLLGFTNSYGAGGYDVYLIKLDSIGKQLWQKTYGGADWDFGYSIAQTADSGYIICGLTYSYGSGNGDVYVVRTDKNGDTLWTRAIGGNGYDVGNSVYVQQDSLYYIAGVTTSFGHGDTSMYLLKINNYGKLEWDTTIGSSHNTIARSINGTTHNGFIIYGSTDSITNNTYQRQYNETMVKLDSTKKIQWWDIFVAIANGGGIGKDAVEKDDGNFLTLGTTNNCGSGALNLDLQDINISGNWQTGACFGGTAEQYGNSIAYRDKDNVVFAGASNSPGYTAGLYDFYVVRFTSDSIIGSYTLKIKNFTDTLSPATVRNLTPSDISIKIYPNPIVTGATILVQGVISANYKFNVYDVSGICVMENIPVNASYHGESVGHLSRTNLTAGIYFYELYGQDKVVATGKLIIE